MRDHNVAGLTDAELDRARRELAASLALARPDSPVRVPILSHMSAIDTELTCRGVRSPVRRRPGQPDTSPGVLPADPAVTDTMRHRPRNVAVRGAR